ncbi:MAG TPA: response regulator [Solirubrobacteraceae bacterium]|nr:response regulator [Solirubrobacteraceae bacterium]
MSSVAETIRVVIADDHAVVRRGLRQVLDLEPSFEVVAEASTLDDARRYVRGHHPDVLVLDLNMPEGSTLKHIPTIRTESPATQIVVLTMQDEPAYARQALSSVRTVETHRAHIQQKLRLGTRAELVRYALDHKLVQA